MTHRVIFRLVFAVYVNTRRTERSYRNGKVQLGYIQFENGLTSAGKESLIISKSIEEECTMGNFTGVCLVTWPWMQAKLEFTLLQYRPLSFSHVNAV